MRSVSIQSTWYEVSEQNTVSTWYEVSEHAVYLV
jgi:hypothetical protein